MCVHFRTFTLKPNSNFKIKVFICTGALTHKWTHSSWRFFIINRYICIEQKIPVLQFVISQWGKLNISHTDHFLFDLYKYTPRVFLKRSLDLAQIRVSHLIQHLCVSSHASSFSVDGFWSALSTVRCALWVQNHDVDKQFCWRDYVATFREQGNVAVSCRNGIVFALKFHITLIFIHVPDQFKEYTSILHLYILFRAAALHPNPFDLLKH